MSRWRELDERWVPTAAAAVARAVERLRSTTGRVAGAGSRAAAAARAASAPEPVRRLDARYAQRGPLAVVRDVPQVGFVVIAGVFFAASAVAFDLTGDDEVRARQQAVERATESAQPLSLGPRKGVFVEEYLTVTKAQAVALSRQSPDRRFLALVSLRRALTVDEAESVAGELDVEQVLLRARVAGAPEVVTVPVEDDDLSDVLRARYAQLVRKKREDQREFAGLASSINPTTEEEQDFKAFYVDAAATAGRESAAYRAGCACVIAFVVRAQAKRLAELPALAAVRGVEVAPLGAQLRLLTVLPLLPEVTGRVPELPGAPGGNGA